jgi:hypothetical protein
MEERKQNEPKTALDVVRQHYRQQALKEALRCMALCEVLLAVIADQDARTIQAGE